ncbi:hypothetical protein FB004_115137 [Sinorhizobium medicae]|uniref:hypothetical protein n=1 Tax=Sinorhizobium medicae TaxID=110321 RepID=UPI0011ADE005|nr:hypothetical protein [Sinorhizobium medicae]TWA17932.1 hypothetical protein FB004_115137 [Sinorhizobium medicae]
MKDELDLPDEVALKSAGTESVRVLPTAIPASFLTTLISRMTSKEILGLERNHYKVS